MANTPEAEGQEEQIGEQEQEEEMEEEVETYVPPKHAKRVYQSKAKDLWEDDDLPSIKPGTIQMLTRSLNATT